METLSRIIHLSNQTELILSNVLQQAMSLIDSNLSLQVTNIFDFSIQLLKSAQSQSSTLSNLMNISISSAAQAANATSTSIDLKTMVTELILNVSNLNRATSITTSENSFTLLQIERHVTLVQNVASELSSTLPPFLTSISMGLASLNETQMV